jgi:hypothetical protein
VGSIEDVSRAAALMRASWSENAAAEFDYDEEFLRSCLAYPGELPVIAPLLMNCLTVAPRWKGRCSI